MTFDAEDETETRTTAGTRPRLVAIAAGLFLAGVVAALFLAIRPAAPEFATVLPGPIELPEFALEDQHGNVFSRARLNGHPSLVFFGFTHCPDICPLTLQKLAAVRRQLVERRDGEIPQIVFVSVDPERDTVERVAAYVGAFGAGLTGVRGTIEQVDRLAGALGAYHARPASGEGYDVEHSAAVFVIDAAGHYRAVFSAPITVDALVSDWPRVVHAMRSVT